MGAAEAVGGGTIPMINRKNWLLIALLGLILIYIIVLGYTVLSNLFPSAPTAARSPQAAAAEQGTPSPRQALGTLTVMDSQGIVKMQDGTANMVDLAAGQVVEPGKGVSGRKWVPATSMSLVTARSWPGDGDTSAQSSPGPSAAARIGRTK